MVAGLLLLPVGFMVVWFVVPLLQFFGNAFTSPRGAMEPFWTLLGTGVYRRIFWNTLVLSLAVTAAAVVIAYPVAYALSRATGSKFQVILYCVLFPLWVSVLVRTFSWILLLETNGPVNRLLMSAGAIDAPLRLLFNNTGVFIGMVHVLTPYAILPIYTSMSRIDDRLLQASDGLGASVFTTFRRIYLPLTMPGVAGGAAFVFLLSLGFFITPALLGGVNAISIAMLIEQFVNEQLDWVSAAAASILLLAAALALLAASARFIRFGVMGVR
jgi:putative spermidine/putrescine transport system permease protein